MTGRALPLMLACCVATAAHGGEKQPWFGDLHVHTRYSYDAFFFGTFASPDDAYGFAKGEPLTHPAGVTLQLDTPLDFYAVTDHAYFLGMWWAIKADPNHPLRADPEALAIIAAETRDERGAAFRKAFRFPKEKFRREDGQSAWQDIQAAAQRHYEPGRFTTLIGFEFTPEPNMDGLHRNVLYRGRRAPPLPISRSDTLNPEDLWRWMDHYRDKEGMEALAIPHNMNLSNGRMFEGAYFDGSPLDAAYAALRMRNEPVVEITQIKGTSDTHPFLSLNDEWAEFEILPFKLGGFNRSQPQGSYVRDALLNGLLFQERLGVNPYHFGFIGSSDTHNGAERNDESTFIGKVGDFNSDAVDRGSVPVPAAGAPTPPEEVGELTPAQAESRARNPRRGHLETARRYHSASGLAGVWAVENTREEVFDALRRKETFATSGPRIAVRFSALAAPPGTDAPSPGSAAWAQEAVPQGGDIAAGGASPSFFASALAAPTGAKLQRLQVIKGWVADGQRFEKVFDVACSDGGAVHRVTHRCPPNGAGVDLSDCSVTPNKGASQLQAVWRDPEFNPTQLAFYYVRALENPTCRWSTWDAVRAGVLPRPDLDATIQERAWSSPIWVKSG